jgi:hypothetical protein
MNYLQMSNMQPISLQKLEAKMDDQNTPKGTPPDTTANHTKTAYNQTGSGANRVARNQAQKDVANYKWGRKSSLLTLKGLGYRSPAYRATKRLVREIEADLGGAENLTAMERQMVQHGAVLGAIAQDYEARYLMGRMPDLLILCRVLKAQRSCFDAVGYRRRQRDVTPPTLEHFLGELKPSE